MLRAVLFDLDGTLVDSAGLIARCLHETLRESGYEVAAETIASSLGPATPSVVQTLTAAQPHEVDRIVKAFGLRYAGRRETIEKYAGADALLDALDREGVALALITNNPEVDVHALLDRLGWAERFAVVLGADSGSGRKPAPGPALHALDTLVVPPEDAAFIGDTETDMRCALDARIATRVHVRARADRYPALPAGLATHTVVDLVELQSLIETLLMAPAQAGHPLRRQS